MQGNASVPGGVADQDREMCILTADWIIDLGPEGGVKGCEIVAEGVPETVPKAKGSFTGKYRAPLLAKRGEAEECFNALSR